jgi:hypothetical protein
MIVFSGPILSKNFHLGKALVSKNDSVHFILAGFFYTSTNKGAYQCEVSKKSRLTWLQRDKAGITEMELASIFAATLMEAHAQ